MSDANERIANLSPQQRKVLFERLRKNRRGPSDSTITPREKGLNRLPLSFAQQRIWFLDQLLAGASTFNIPSAFRLTGTLNLTAFQATLNEIVRRHEILHTTFDTVDREAVQIIAPGWPVEIEQADLAHLPPDERETEVERLTRREAKRPFDLTKGPLLRATLLQLGEFEQIFLLTLHHVVWDGWSMGPFLREFKALYEGLASDAAGKVLPELPIQYGDFTLWQREFLQGDVLDSHISFWKDRLAGAPPVLNLPTDRKRRDGAQFRGVQKRFSLSKELFAALKALSRQEETTLFTILLAAFKALLHGYSGQDDMVLGSPIANRHRAEVEDLIGCFMNPLPMRTDLSGDPTFRELLHRVRATVLEAQAHQDLPFDLLVKAVQPRRDLEHAPLFQVMFLLQDYPMRGRSLKTLDLNMTPLHVLDDVIYPLALIMVESSDGIEGLIEYDAAMFETICSQMPAHFEAILSSAVNHPDRRLSQLPLLAEAERSQVLVEWNQTPEKDVTSCIHELFEAQVERTPDAVAVVFEDEQLSYRALNARANRLAHYLRKGGVGPEERVGICLERSQDLVVGLLAVLKAGGAYVPLDPSHPAERLDFMLEDSSPSVFLTRQSVIARSEFTVDRSDLRVVCLDHDWEAIAQEKEENPQPETVPQNLAYVMYTSGSTGRPKGVMIQHQSVANYIEAAIEAFAIESTDRVLQFAPISFDTAVEEIYPTLACGAMLVLRSSSMLDSVAEFLQQCQASELTVLDLPTAYWHMLVDEMAGSDLRLPQSLRLVILGGERARPDKVESWRQQVQGTTRLFNTYGPTEATVVATLCELQASDNAEEGLQEVPIGRVVRNAQSYVLNRHLRPVPVGVVGELHIAGLGLARGYLNGPDLTAAEFVPEPFSDRPGSRMYSSGDQVRYLRAGDLEFHGRKDQQIKIRGFRVEPGEIEAALAHHPAVKQAVVVAKDSVAPLSSRGSKSAKRLVAYVVAKPRTAPSNQDLRDFLLAKLPDYMIPPLFVFLDRLPLSANGKVDARALPEPESSGTALQESLVPPRTAVEQELATIWRQIFGLKRLGVHENFFELGGDSIISLQIIARAGEVGLKLTPRQLFQHQTIATLAQVATAKNGSLAEQGEVSGEMPLTPIQYGFLAQESPDLNHFNQAVLFELEQPIEADVIRKAIRAIISHHDALRLRFVRESAGWRQYHASMADETPVEFVDLTGLPPEKQQPRFEAKASELQSSLSLSEGPLVRAALFDCGPDGPARLLLIIHHLVVDGLSWRILLEDLDTAFRQLAVGEEVSLPRKSTSFRDWAEHLEAFGRTEAFTSELGYWLELSGRTVSALPVDRQEGENSEASTQTVTVSLDRSDTSDLLKTTSRAYQTQVNDVLLTALARALSEWTGERAFVINLESHGRDGLVDEVDVSRTVGWFTSLFPVLLDLEGAADVGEELVAVKGQLGRIPSRGIPFGLSHLLPESEMKEKLRSIARAEVLFNYLGQFDAASTDRTLFRTVEDAIGPTRSSKLTRAYLLEINGLVKNGSLHMSWSYSVNRHRRDTIEKLAQAFLKALRAIIRHCQSVSQQASALPDRSEFGWNQEDLEDIFAEIGNSH